MIISQWWWVPIFLLLGCIILAMTVNAVFIYIALILIFILIPTVLMFTYFNHLATTEARIAVLQKSITIDNAGIHVNFEPIKHNDIEHPSNEKTPNPIFISRSEFKQIENMGNSIMIHLTGRKYRFISIPIDAINGNATDFWHIFCNNHCNNLLKSL